jgi:hypothetical protein
MRFMRRIGLAAAAVVLFAPVGWGGTGPGR